MYPRRIFEHTSLRYTKHNMLPWKKAPGNRSPTTSQSFVNPHPLPGSPLPIDAHMHTPKSSNNSPFLDPSFSRMTSSSSYNNTRKENLREILAVQQKKSHEVHFLRVGLLLRYNYHKKEVRPATPTYYLSLIDSHPFTVHKNIPLRLGACHTYIINCPPDPKRSTDSQVAQTFPTPASHRPSREAKKEKEKNLNDESLSLIWYP